MLTAAQRRLIDALMASATIAAACATANVSPRSYRRWKESAEFCDAVKDAHRQAFGEALQFLQRVAGAAVGTLAAGMKSRNDAVKVRAAMAILDRAQKGIELQELADEVKELRRLVEARHGRSR